MPEIAPTYRMSAVQRIIQEKRSVIVSFVVETVQESLKCSSSKGESMMQDKREGYLKSYQCRVILTFCEFAIIDDRLLDDDGCLGGGDV